MSCDDIVISGVSGRFPNARNVEVLAENLYNGVDMVDTENVRFQSGGEEKTLRMGNIADDSKFDAQFFGIRFQLVQNMDPQGRMLIEHSFEAAIDAGWSPKSLRGAKIGVFVGSGTSEYENTWCFEKIGPGGFGITGCSRAMLANRISYCLGINGPSFLLDTACSSSMCALDVAYRAIKDGQCEAAMVGGVNLLLSRGSNKVYAEVGFVAPDGYCRPFDNNASGYNKSEAVTMLFLQKRKDARRVYATVVNTRSEYDGSKDVDMFKFSGDQQRIMLENFYHEIKIDPASVGYLEAHGSGLPSSDFEECQAADAIFCKNRKEPLLIGSIKSNLGHAEPASGGCAITKALLAFQTGKIPPNLHFSQCRQDVPALVEGRLKVVTETTPLNGPLIAVNSFGFTGHNAHCLLRMFDKEKVNNGLPQDRWPRLVVWSGRTEEAINTLLDSITKRPLDVEQVALINDIQSDSTSGYVFRGFGLYEQQSADTNAVCLGRDVKHFSGVKRPLVFVFSGMGSQWCEMGTSLMTFPIFRDSIQVCHDVLAQHGLDLINILTSPDPTMYDNILHSFVGIAAIQIGLVDILRVLEIKPDYIIGHSVGELGCAYADGSLTAEQMIMAAYSRGMASVESNVIFGAMAAVGLGYRNIRPLLPAGVEVACHNSANSCTISGPADLISGFVVELKKKKIFAREVPCSNIPYHSKYIQEFGPKLLSRLRQVIPEPKARSSKWLSTSVPKKQWDQPESQLCSAEYHTNNLLSPVLFEETAVLLPSNAILLEIAPHRLLQGILKQSMPESVYVGLTQRNSKEISLLFNGIGQLYYHGYDSMINRLYPKVEYPVSRGTPMLSPYVRWDHSAEWYVVDFSRKTVKNTGFKQFTIAKDVAWQAMEGHVIDGRTLIPETAYLHYVWETFATLRSKPMNEMEIVFSDVKFLRPTVLAQDTDVKFSVRIQSGTGEFEISEDANSIVSGFIREVDMENLSDIPVVEDTGYPMLATKDFYNEMNIRGYEYAGQYNTVVEARGDGLVGAVKWQHNWTTFLDSLLQVQMMTEDTRDPVRPIAIEKLLIKTMEHASIVQDLDPSDTVLAVEASRYLNMMRCGGVEISGLTTGPMARRKLPKHVLESYSFVSHLPAPKMGTCDALRLVVQLAMDNLYFEKLRVMEVDCKDKEPVVPTLKTVLNDLPHSGFELFLQTQRHFSFVQVRVGLAARSDCQLVIAGNCLTHTPNLEIAQQSLCNKGYILSREKSGVSLTAPPGCQLIAAFPTETETFLLLQAQNQQKMTSRVVKASSEDFTWLTEVRQAIKTGPVVVVAENETLTGAVGLVGCVRKERNGHKLTAVVIEDTKAPPFDVNHPLYKNQLNMGLAVNIFKDGHWGSLRRLELDQHLDTRKRQDHSYVTADQLGDLSSLSWTMGPFNFGRPKGELVRVQFVGLNLRDVLLGSGKLTPNVFALTRLDKDYAIGSEFSGVSERSRRIMGMVVGGAAATYVEADDILTWECPDKWTLQQAATVPVVYGVVYTAFFMVGQISKGKSVLIHAGCSDVGLAALRVATSYGLTVYTTVANAQEREFLLKTFAVLAPENVGSCQDTSFEDLIKLRTRGKGVDFVLNSLEADKLQASLRCVAKGGKFLEIGQSDMARNQSMGLGQFLKAISFHSIIIDTLLRASTAEKQALRVIIDRDLKSGIIVPLKAIVFPAKQVEKALRQLTTGRSTGKILLQIRERETDEPSLPITVRPRVHCNPQFAYMVCGDLGILGLEFLDWLIVRNCRKLCVNTKTVTSTDYLNYRLRIWRSYGVEIVTSTANMATKIGCKTMVAEAAKLGPIGGIFNLPTSHSDAEFEHLDHKVLDECVARKVTTTKLLDEISRKLCPQLQYFVAFTEREIASKSIDGLTNSIVEHIIERRHSQGLPAKVLQWSQKVEHKVSSCLKALDALITNDSPIVCSSVTDNWTEGVEKSVIEAVMDVMSLKSVEFNKTLPELGMNPIMAAEIKQLLERELELFFADNDIDNLTLGKIQKLTEDPEKLNRKMVNREVPLSMAELLRNLTDRGINERTIVRLEVENKSKRYSSSALIVPGIEGVLTGVWDDLARSLTASVCVAQLKSAAEEIGLTEINTQTACDVKLEVFRQTEFFYLIGYSFGAFATLELARVLEATGMTGHVVLIDGAPEFLKKTAIRLLGDDYMAESLQTTLFTEIVRVMVPDAGAEVVKTILSTPKWTDRVDRIVQVAGGQKRFSEPYIRRVIATIFNRIRIALNINLATFVPIKSPITLVRPNQVSLAEIDEHYGLAQCTEGQVTTRFIEGNHISMLANPELAQIINKFDPVTHSTMTFKRYIESS